MTNINAYSIGLLSWALSALSLAPFATAHAESPAPSSVRLYTLDCGRIQLDDMAMFADTGEYDGRPGKVVAPCFLIRHPKGDLLWDTGLDEALIKQTGGEVGSGFHMSYGRPLAEQLAQIGLTAQEIDFVAFSHMHSDHTGGANAFTEATWILNQRELAWALLPESASSGAVDPRTFDQYKNVATQLIDGDYDVFGDGSVKILRTPGHTPGHQILALRLARQGNVVLSGDLFHTKENERELRVPAFNVNRADTLASFDRTFRILRNKRARFVVQHAPEDFNGLPRFPKFLD